MNPQPTHNLTAARAADLLQQGLPVSDSYIGGALKLEGVETWDKEVLLENCIVENFSGSASQFTKAVRLVNCHFKSCQFVFTYFLGGLEITGCSFDNCLDFQAGGHNKAGQPVRITYSRFTGFVNFFDCWYESAVTIAHNDFQQGTNLLGKPHNIPVTFDFKPTIRDNKGRLDFDNEGPDPE
ncbi:MAG: hypothetical protein ACRYFX_30505 [Janthinobacterium lividum]